MSTRALRRLKGKQRGQEALDLGDLTLGDTPEEQAEAEEEQLDTANVSLSSNKKNDGRKALFIPSESTPPEKVWYLFSARHYSFKT
uniref:Uncharacterized protein n=1 Tax=Oreochromis niloticus TaxID=8128 RepID=A0A669BDX0_ORENI